MDESVTVDLTKRHKKHKHKKHKKKRESGQMETKLKTLTPTVTLTGSPRQDKMAISPKGVKKKKMKSGRDSGTSSDEERWLSAIQSGKLEEVDDELKKIKRKDPKLMTARQRAMMERKGDAVPDPGAEQLVSLPSGYREKVLTPEMIKNAALKAQKRKQLMDEKKEKDMKRTMDRLLKKQDNKITKQVKKSVKKIGITIAYCNNQEGVSISLPPGIEYPLAKQVAPTVPPVVKCGIPGCEKPKKYSCSKTKIPLCSLECYKKNLSKASKSG